MFIFLQACKSGMFYGRASAYATAADAKVGVLYKKIVLLPSELFEI